MYKRQTIDRAYVDHKFGSNVSAKAGRFQQTIGGGLMYDDTFDGAQLNVGNDKVQVQGAYGYMIDGAADGNSKSDNPSVSYVAVSYTHLTSNTKSYRFKNNEW